jgi:hypothetical protein
VRRDPGTTVARQYRDPGTRCFPRARPAPTCPSGRPGLFVARVLAPRLHSAAAAGLHSTGAPRPGPTRRTPHTSPHVGEASE